MHNRGLSDVTKDGKLDVNEFSIAFYLIQWRLSRRDLPETLPASLLASVGLSAASPAPAKTTPTPAPAPKVPVAPALIDTPPAGSSSTLHLGGGFAPAPGGALLGVLGVTATAHGNPSATNPTPSTPSYLGTNPSPNASTSTSPSASLSTLPNYIGTNSGTSTPSYLGTNPSPGTASGTSTPSYLGTNPNPGPSSVATAGQSTEFNWSLTVQDKATYTGYFGMADPTNSGFVKAETARTLFSRSKLANTTLANIWQLSDDDKDGQLSLQEFMIAMHLINAALKNCKFDKVPEALYASVHGTAAAPGVGLGGHPTSTLDLSSNPLAAAATGHPIVAAAPPKPAGPDPAIALMQQQKLEEERRELERLKKIAADVRFVVYVYMCVSVCLSVCGDDLACLTFL